MAAKVYLHSKQPVARGVTALIADRTAWLGRSGTVTNGYASRGKAWTVGFQIPTLTEFESVLPGLLTFLQGWGVPPDAYLQVLTGNNRVVVERRVEVWGGAERVISHPRPARVRTWP